MPPLLSSPHSEETNHMTDAQIQQLIDNCKGAGSDPNRVEWNDLKNVLSSFLTQVNFTDLSPLENQIPKFLGGQWTTVDPAGAGGQWSYPANMQITGPASQAGINLSFSNFDQKAQFFSVVPNGLSPSGFGSPWTMGFESNDNSSPGEAIPQNMVLHMGYNITPQGAMVNPLKGAFFNSWETSYYISSQFGYCFEYHLTGRTQFPNTQGVPSMGRRHLSILSSYDRQLSYAYFTLSKFYIQSDNVAYPTKAYFEIIDTGKILLGIGEDIPQGYIGELTINTSSGTPLVSTVTKNRAKQAALKHVTNAYFDIGDATYTPMMTTLPVFANNVAAAGLPLGAIYQTPTGELRIKV